MYSKYTVKTGMKRDEAYLSRQLLLPHQSPFPAHYAGKQWRLPRSSFPILESIRSHEASTATAGNPSGLPNHITVEQRFLENSGDCCLLRTHRYPGRQRRHKRQFVDSIHSQLPLARHDNMRRRRIKTSKAEQTNKLKNAGETHPAIENQQRADEEAHREDAGIASG